MSEFDNKTTDNQSSTKPNLSRVQNNKRKNKNGFVAALLIIAIAFVALFPTFHYFIAENPTEHIAEPAKKSSSKSSSVKSSSKASSKSSSSSSSSSQQSSSSSSSSQSSQQTEENNNTQENNAGTYTVAAGDSLYTIAQNNGLTIDQLLQLNGLTADSAIYPGMSLKLK